MMRGFCPMGFCPEGAYVLMELCMEGVLSKGVLSEGVLSEGVLSGGGFVLPSANNQVDLGSPFNTSITIHHTALSCWCG